MQVSFGKVIDTRSILINNNILKTNNNVLQKNINDKTGSDLPVVAEISSTFRDYEPLSKDERIKLMMETDPQQGYFFALTSNINHSFLVDVFSDYGKIASNYAELKNEIENKYTGDELNTHLKWLDEAYDKNVDVSGSIHARIAIGAAGLYESTVELNNSFVITGIEKECFMNMIRNS